MILAGTEKGLIDVSKGGTLLAESIDALAPGTNGWWAIAGGYRVLTSADAREWNESVVVRGLRANCVIEHDGGALVGTSEAHLVAVTGGSIARVSSFDAVPTRDTWYTPWGGPPDTRSLTRDASGAVLASVHVGGILRSDDGEWRATAMDVDADVHQVLAHPTEPDAALAATAIGLATTRDGGASWEFTEEGLHAAYCRAVAIAGDTILLSASRSHTGRHAAVYRRPLSGGAFERCATGLPEWFADNVDTYSLAARGERAVIGTSDGLVFVSDDAGQTWEQEAAGLPSINCIVIAGSP